MATFDKWEALRKNVKSALDGLTGVYNPTAEQFGQSVALRGVLRQMETLDKVQKAGISKKS